MKDKKRLLFFTEKYPYGKGEAFIENEIKYLSEAFDEITILPWSAKTDYVREVPGNCKVLKPMMSGEMNGLRLGIFCLAPVFYFVKKYFSEKAYKSISKTLKFFSVSIFCRAILSNKDFKRVNREFENDTVYFYWGYGSAYVIPFIKSKKKIIVRFHRTDLYLEQRSNRYIPFRKDVYTNLTKAVYISRQGLEYAMMHYGKYNFDATVSYLGTTDYGIFPKSGNREILKILSCSNVVPVKRVHLLLEALLRIKDLKIEWTHIGDGECMHDLKGRIKDVPDNLKIVLKGALPNKEVIQYYKENVVDVFINVSSSEGLPVSIMEAISFNIPVIATNVGGTSEIVNEETGILIDSDFDTGLLAKKIIELSDNRDKYEPRKFWEQHFNAEINYADFINRVLLPVSEYD